MAAGLLGLLLAAGTSCRLLAGPAEEDSMDDGTIRIYETTQYRLRTLRIGVGNIRTEQYVDEQGLAREALTAGLWLSYKDDPSRSRQLRAHVGQEIATDECTLRVVEVGRKDGRGFVRLSVIGIANSTPNP